MESLLLFRRALTSPTMCRFIPALSVPSTPLPFNSPSTPSFNSFNSICAIWVEVCALSALCAIRVGFGGVRAGLRFLGFGP